MQSVRVEEHYRISFKFLQMNEEKFQMNREKIERQNSLWLMISVIN